MASDDDMREMIDRVDAALERNREASDRNTAAFDRNAAASDRNTAAFDRFIRADDRNARAWDTTASIVTGVLETLTEMLETLRDGRGEQRAQTQAILRLLDEKSGGSPAA